MSTQTALMPPEAPLTMPEQMLGQVFEDPRAPGAAPAPRALRAVLFVLAALLSVFVAGAFWTWFGQDVSLALRLGVCALVVMTIFWIALSPLLALIGLFCRPWRPAPTPTAALDVAVLVPIYGEPLAEIERMLGAHLASLAAFRTDHRFTLYVLSDTQDPTAVARQRASIAALRARHFDQRIYYRNRPQNTDFKTGNLRDWVTRWGGGHEAMLVLDADSFMPAHAMAALADALAARPQAGLIQTIPRLHRARTLFGRMQQFSHEVAGRALGEGLAVVSRAEGNFWGHNAILRTRAYAASAGLPHLPGRMLGGVILSHDFVEAALLRRAGWEVRLLPEVRESFEEGPQTPLGHVLRDRRWCRGNLQHARVLGAHGLAGFSRFHMVQGIMAYVASVLWCGLLVIWSVTGLSPPVGELVYFSAQAPLFPVWPTTDLVSKLGVMGLVFALLLAPRALGAVMHVWRDPTLAKFGGRGRFALSLVVETALSVVIAPMMMVQHVRAVAIGLVGRAPRWRPHAVEAPSWRDLMRFHWVETVLGIALTTACAVGWVSVWSLPIALSLLAAVPLSWGMGRVAPFGLMRTPPDVVAPARTVRLRPVPAPLP